MSKIAVHSRASRFPERRAARRADAAERLELSSSQTPQQRLAVLDQRLGEGRGATRERLRLHARIAQAAAEAQKALEAEQKKAAKKDKKPQAEAQS